MLSPSSPRRSRVLLTEKLEINSSPTTRRARHAASERTKKNDLNISWRSLTAKSAPTDCCIHFAPTCGHQAPCAPIGIFMGVMYESRSMGHYSITLSALSSPSPHHHSPANDDEVVDSLGPRWGEISPICVYTQRAPDIVSTALGRVCISLFLFISFALHSSQLFAHFT